MWSELRMPEELEIVDGSVTSCASLVSYSNEIRSAEDLLGIVSGSVLNPAHARS